jgi:hypothetical protein
MKIYRISTPIPFYEKLEESRNNYPQNFFDTGLELCCDHTTQHESSKFEKMFPGASPLGAGAFGMAFDIGNNKIAKITRDDTEVKNARKFKKNPNTNIIKIHDVFRLSTNSINYVIIMDKVYPLDKNEEKIYEFTYHWFSHYGLADLQPFDSEVMNKIFSRYKIKKTPESIQTLNKSIKFIESLYNINMFEDAHERNIGKIGDSFVRFDLGFA